MPMTCVTNMPIERNRRRAGTLKIVVSVSMYMPLDGLLAKTASPAKIFVS